MVTLPDHVNKILNDKYASKQCCDTRIMEVIETGGMYSTRTTTDESLFFSFFFASSETLLVFHTWYSYGMLACNLHPRPCSFIINSIHIATISTFSFHEALCLELATSRHHHPFINAPYLT